MPREFAQAATAGALWGQHASSNSQSVAAEQPQREEKSQLFCGKEETKAQLGETKAGSRSLTPSPVARLNPLGSKSTNCLEDRREGIRVQFRTKGLGLLLQKQLPNIGTVVPQCLLLLCEPAWHWHYMLNKRFLLYTNILLEFSFLKLTNKTI